MVIVSLDSPSCEVTLFDPVYRWFIGTFTLTLPALTLGVEGSINRLVEVVEAVVQQRILDVIILPLLEILLLVTINSDVSRGITGKLKETVTILRHRHRSLK
jgi:hypothetical protein